MRIAIDLQGAQTESRFRGIGRYTLELTKAIVRNRGEHEILLVLSGLFPETISYIRNYFRDLVPIENFKIWSAPGPVYEADQENAPRRQAAELIREAFIASLRVDLLHVPSFFEGYGDDAVLSIGKYDSNTPVSVTVHDLIPLLYPDEYLAPSKQYSDFYFHKLEQLKKANLVLAISESSKREVLEHLSFSEDVVFNTSEAIGDVFRVREIPNAERDKLLSRFGIDRKFVLYCGGADRRKNLPFLIEAFARLPEDVRGAHQLVFAGKMPDGNIKELREIASKAGLAGNELCFTGYLTDEELVSFYNLCEVFVFPTWHEGFGLPVLEAMSCGAAVIASNTSSLPEVVGLPEALFDPYDIDSISQKLLQVLSDKKFQSKLREHGKKHAKNFSWDISAKKAIRAWEEFFSKPYERPTLPERWRYETTHGLDVLNSISAFVPRKDRILRSAIAACLAQNRQGSKVRQLFLDVSEICHRDAATGVQRVVRSYLRELLRKPVEGFVVQPVYATRNEGYRYARKFTCRFLGMDPESMEDTPIVWERGDVFFALDMQHHVQLARRRDFELMRRDGVVVKFLVHDLLPIQLPEFFKDSDARELHENLMELIAGTDGAICVSHATAQALDEWLSSKSVARAANFKIEVVHNGADIGDAGSSKGLPEGHQEVLAALRSRPSFLSVSTVEPRKGYQQIVEAFSLLWEEGVDVNLVIVGKEGWKVEALAKFIREHPQNGIRLFWLEGISDEYLEKVYSEATCLIAASINEGFGLAVIEAARHRLPIVARDIPVFREVAGDCAYYFQGNEGSELAKCITDWLQLREKRLHPSSSELKWNTWEESAGQLIERLVHKNCPQRQLLVDVSELVQRDARSGIQRVVRSVLREWLNNPPEGVRVEPVYATLGDKYRYARRFTAKFLGLKEDDAVAEETLIEYAPGDVFFGLDMQPQVQIAQQKVYQKLRDEGVTVKFLLHDILSLQMPEYFPQGNEEGFRQWLEVLVSTDGVVCVSKAVADDLRQWLQSSPPSGANRYLSIDWSHNGGDIESSVPSLGVPEWADAVLSEFKCRPSFLMVGTIEPRKAHAQVLEAFDEMWKAGEDINLVIVGKQGWAVEGLVKRIEQHYLANKRLYWLKGISDEFLELVYKSCDCLLAASYGEGFGLPLIEAARAGIPVIARDNRVFREVGGNCVTYMEDSRDPHMVVEAVRRWLKNKAMNNVPQIQEMKWLSWHQSAERLAGIVLAKAGEN